MSMSDLNRAGEDQGKRRETRLERLDRTIRECLEVLRDAKCSKDDKLCTLFGKLNGAAITLVGERREEEGGS